MSRPKGSSKKPRSPFLWVPLCLTVALIPLPSLGQAGEPAIKAIEIRHVGPRSVSDDLVRANIRVKSGDPYSKVNIDDDVRNLYSTGFFFNIQVVESREADGVRLVYRVQSRPTLSDIRFQGNVKFSTKKLTKKLSSKVGHRVNVA